MCTLTLEYQSNGSLDDYLSKYENTDTPTRARRAIQAARAIEAVHNSHIVHADVAPRNFLLDDKLNIRICDFGGSSHPGRPVPLSAPGARYQSLPWAHDYKPTEADDIFAFGSVLYFIAKSEEGLCNLNDDEIEHRFSNRDFPATDSMMNGDVIQRCWNGCFPAAGLIVTALSGE